MFVSFFPRPRPFFISMVVWLLLAILLWQFGARDWGGVIGLPPAPAGQPPIIGLSVFWSKPFLWFDLYFWAAVASFGLFWQLYAPHPWARWSVWGSALILFVTYLQVQVSVAINAWYGPFYDLIQTALSHGGAGTVTSGQFYRQLLTFSDIALASITVVVLTHFFVSHYIFRWRTAMNGYYMAHWTELRGIEGAAQRVQDDTMRFATTLEVLGVALINSVMTLIAFLPVLTRLSADVTELPLVGPVPDALVIAAVLWSLFGTSFLAAIGIRLPGLEFRNQLVEAAYRKELVYGEDEAARAQPPTMAALFSHIRHNYFRLYLHFMYFNIGRYFYLQADVVFPYIVLAPTIVAGKITFGLLQQILGAFDQVRSSFQYLINAWTTIVELLSIYQRLRRFEAVIGDNQPSSALSPAR